MHDALPEHGELFILLRSIPTHHKVVWQDLVDIPKVYSALHKLKEINPLYHAINLPTSASGLQLDQKISECIAEEPNNDDKKLSLLQTMKIVISITFGPS